MPKLYTYRVLEVSGAPVLFSAAVVDCPVRHFDTLDQALVFARTLSNAGVLALVYRGCPYATRSGDEGFQPVRMVYRGRVVRL